MQKELLQFKMQKVWILVDLPHRKRAIGHTQEEGINYEEVFAPVARIEAIRLFLAYASFMGFMVYQMDVKSPFLYGTIEEEVYVCQPPGFEDPDHPDKVYKVVKTLYGLHQAPRACQPTFAVRNTLEKEKVLQDLDMLAFDAALREYCDRNYHQLLSIITEKVHQEKVQQEKLKEVKARLNFEKASQHYESGTPNPVEIHNIKQRDGESTEEFVRRYKLECRDAKGAPKCMKISGFMHGITKPELIKRLHDEIPKSVDEIMRQEAGHKQNYKKGGFLNQQRPERKHDRQIEEMLKDKKLSHLLKELKQNNEKYQANEAKKGKTSGKDKPMAIRWQMKQKRGKPQEKTNQWQYDGEEDETKGPMIIEAKMERHFVHRVYLDEGSSSEILKDRSKENPDSAVYSSRNAKIPSERRIGHITKQHDYSIRMHNGFRTRSAAAHNKPSHRRKNSASNSPRISGTNNINRLYFNRRKTEGASACKIFVNEVCPLDKRRWDKHIREISWRMFVDFKDLNKACPKDGYPLSEIDWKVESLSEMAFKEMRKLIAELTMLTAPKEKEELIIYLAAAKEAISAVLIRERDGKQMPIYFVSRTLIGLEINYTPMEKLILALILADFIMERPEDDPPDTPMEDKEELLDLWILFTDGSSCIDDSGAGLIITNPKRSEFTYALSFAHLSKQVLVDELKEKSIDERQVLAVVEEEGRTWMTLIYEYLSEKILPEEKRKAKAICHKASRYFMTNEILYKRSFPGPWSPCVGLLQENYVLREIHEGSCSMHVDPRSMVAKALRSGYYWPTMHTDARKLIKECSSCQRINIEGPFSEGPGKVKFLIVAIDYFTKWIEVKPVANITGAQFIDNPFKDWCKKLCIRQCFASDKHPQANGLVARANRSLGKGIKAQLDERSKNWLEEISHVLWVHRTMIKSCNGETSFSLTYGTKAMIQVEDDMPTLRNAEVDMIKMTRLRKLT
nr:reverse transcriptase domain-containing protein [Tanacetum cinerariifolium]